MKALRFVLLVALCALGLFPGITEAAYARYSRMDIGGKSYVRLTDWAGANNFSVHWLKVGDTLQLGNANVRLIVNRDSREAELSGVRICLSYPVLLHNGVPYISQMDLDTAINPVLSPPQNWLRARVKNIVLDPGHGGKDSGNQDGSHQEKTYTLLLAKEIRDQLNQAGFNTSLTRASDTFVELPERPSIARRRAADLFISLHWNDLPRSKDMKGCQVFCMTPEGASSSNAGGEVIGAGHHAGNRNNQRNMLLAYDLQKSLLKNVGMDDRGVRRARYWVLRDAEMPAVLIEGGFMSNPSEAHHIYDANYRHQMARAIVQGVLNYKHQVER
jgi:N-acetylmuramoyl-L-alanine amidase